MCVSTLLYDILSLTIVCLISVYVNSYLASLNVRKTLLSSIKSAHAGGIGGEDGLVSIHLSHSNSPGMTQNMPSFRNATGMTASGMSGMTGMFELGVGTTGLLSVPERSGTTRGPRVSLNVRAKFKLLGTEPS